MLLPITKNRKLFKSDHIKSKPINRRLFLSKISKISAGFALAAATSGLEFSDARAWPFTSSSLDQLIKKAPTAKYWISSDLPGVNCMACHKPEDKMEKNATQYEHDEKIIKCRLCAQECIIYPGKRGRCRARINIDGELKTLVYGRPVSIHIDPVEKKPFYHFMPGSPALSLSTAGCPLHCKFCQNWELSQANPEDLFVKFVRPQKIVNQSILRNVPIIAFTYNEPTVFTEYLLDIAKFAKEKKIRNVLISCGFMNEEPLCDMCNVLSAIKVDLKGYDKNFYKKVCGAKLDPVLNTIKYIAKTGVHLEIVNLVVPTLNDSEKMLNDLIDWILDEVGSDVPVHFTRFHPDYKMPNLPPTPVATLEKAYDMAMTKGIHYPYVGNVPGHPGNNTYCPNCHKPVIKRTGFFITELNMKDGRCKFCAHPIKGVWI